MFVLHFANSGGMIFISSKKNQKGGNNRFAVVTGRQV
jgi:hypothetical protein